MSHDCDLIDMTFLQLFLTIRSTWPPCISTWRPPPPDELQFIAVYRLIHADVHSICSVIHLESSYSITASSGWDNKIHSLFSACYTINHMGGGLETANVHMCQTMIVADFNRFSLHFANHTLFFLAWFTSQAKKEPGAEQETTSATLTDQLIHPKSIGWNHCWSFLEFVWSSI